MKTDADMGSPKVVYVHLLVVAGFVLTIAARLFELTKYGLWMDEVFSLRVARLDWSLLFQQVIADVVHPPLFYVILKVWILIGGESLLWLKTLPVLLAVAALAPLYLLCRGLGIRLAEFALALIFISLNAFLIYYAQELRMYSLLLFLNLLSMWLFTKFLRDDSDSKHPILLLFAINLLLVYTHYFGWFTVLAEFVFTLFYHREKLKWITIQTIAVAALFLPWVLAIISAISQKGGVGQNLGWIDKPGLTAVPLFLAESHGKLPFRHTIAIGSLIFGIPLALWLLQIYRGRNRTDTRLFVYLSLFCTLPMVIAFAVSQTSTSIWVDRYLIAAGIPYILLLAVAVLRIQKTAIRTAFVTLMILWSLGVGLWNISQQRARVNWTALSSKITERDQVAETEKVFVLEEWAAMPLQHSLSDSGQFDASLQKVKVIEDIGETDFWLSYRSTTWRQLQSPAEKFRQANCVVDTETADAPDNETVHLIHVNCPR